MVAFIWENVYNSRHLRFVYVENTYISPLLIKPGNVLFL